MKLPATALFAATLALLSAVAEPDNAPAEPARYPNSAALLRAECQALRLMLADPAANPAFPVQSTTTNLVVVASKRETAETALLRAECQALRLMLAEPEAIPVPRSLRTNAPPASVEAQTAAAEGLTHWLTTSSGIRHNNTCSRHEKTKGRFCAPDEGKPCRQCGG